MTQNERVSTLIKDMPAFAWTVAVVTVTITLKLTGTVTVSVSPCFHLRFGLMMAKMVSTLI